MNASVSIRGLRLLWAAMVAGVLLSGSSVPGALAQGRGRGSGGGRDQVGPSRDANPPVRGNDSFRRSDPPVRSDEGRSRGNDSFRRSDPPVRSDEGRSRGNDSFRRSDPPVRSDEGRSRGNDSFRRSGPPVRSDDGAKSRDPGVGPSRDTAGSQRSSDPTRGRPGYDQGRARPGRDTGPGQTDLDNNRQRVGDRDRRGDGVQRDVGARGRDGGNGGRETIGGNRRPGGSGEYRNRSNDRAGAIFTRSNEGRRYDHGISLRPGRRFDDRPLERYFPHRYIHYPHYCSSFISLQVFYSPYWCYFGIYPPYVYRRHTLFCPPPVVYVEVPVYVGGVYRGWDDWDDYYLVRRRDRADAYTDDTYLRDAVNDLEDAFRYGDIDRLAPLTDAAVRIAVCIRGKYEYSVEAGDYLDMTRDAFRTTDTVSFDLGRVRRKADGVVVASGKHVYRDRDGQHRGVYITFVLERLNGRWTITQVDTTPEKLRDL